MKLPALALLLAAALPAARVDSTSGQRHTPPVIASVSPRGLARGTSVELVVEGLNLAGATKIYFSDPGLKGRILQVKELPDQPDLRLGSNGTVSSVDLGPLPPRNQVTVDVEIAPSTPVGPVDFRLLTPLGTTLAARVMVEPFYGESPDREPNDTPEEAFETFLPACLAGTIAKPGDVDYFKIHIDSAEELVFSNSGGLLNSALQPLVTITDENNQTVRAFRLDRDHPAHADRLPGPGTYYIRISDSEQGGSANHLYRILAGKFPYVLSAFPLGMPRNESGTVALTGYNLGTASSLTVKGVPSAEDPNALFLRPKTAAGLAFNRVKLAIGPGPESTVPETAKTAASALPVSAPVTLNGRLTEPEHYFRFHAKQGQIFTIETNARRLGSPLDSLIEVLDAQARPIETATVRAINETSTSLRDHDSLSKGIRLATSSNLDPGDYVMIGGEIVRIETIPPNADNDFIFESFAGERLAFFHTSPEAHALDSPAYKVQIAPPGTRFPSNGLPLVHLTYRNDDGGPGYGKDSRLLFTAPADADYLVRLRDVRGLTGPDYSYRLSIHEPAPAYRLSVSPANPNVPAGGTIPLTVTAMRIDGHDSPIPVSLTGLPAGLHATKAVIAPGQTRTTILLSADANAKLADAVPLNVTDGKGTVANPEDSLKLIALAPKPDVQMTAETREAVLTPDRDAEISVSIVRNNGFAGRVPVEVRNLPPGVEVSDTGLNGVLINENETKRTFKLHMLPTAQPLTQPIYASGQVETRAGGQQNTFTSQQILLTVAPKTL